MDTFAVVIFLLGLVAASMLRKHLREAKQLHLRQIIHEERMKAMDNGQPLPEIDDSTFSGVLGAADRPEIERNGWLVSSVLWVRIVALCLGLAGFFGGIGTAFAMSQTRIEDFNEAWTMGLIPAFVGVGLLIFYAMSGRFLQLAREAGEE